MKSDIVRLKLSIFGLSLLPFLAFILSAVEILVTATFGWTSFSDALRSASILLILPLLMSQEMRRALARGLMDRGVPETSLSGRILDLARRSYRSTDILLVVAVFAVLLGLLNRNVDDLPVSFVILSLTSMSTFLGLRAVSFAQMDSGVDLADQLTSLRRSIQGFFGYILFYSGVALFFPASLMFLFVFLQAGWGIGPLVILAAWLPLFLAFSGISLISGYMRAPFNDAPASKLVIFPHVVLTIIFRFMAFWLKSFFVLSLLLVLAIGGPSLLVGTGEMFRSIGTLCVIILSALAVTHVLLHPDRMSSATGEAGRRLSGSVEAALAWIGFGKKA